MLKPAFVKRCHEAVEALRADTRDGGPALFVTTPWREDGKLYNAIICLDKGEIIGKRYKVDLPNYGVFDEKRVFAPGPMPGPLVFKGVRIGVPICEDVWTPDVVECISETGGEILLVPNGSPYEVGKTDVRVQLGVKRVVESGLPFVYLNQVGGQDEVIYDGGSFVLGADRALKAKLASFREEVATVEFRRNGRAAGNACPAGSRPSSSDIESIYQAMMLGLRDYVNKTGFPSVVIGLSGGVDSALTAAVAADALGPERVHTLMMPSPYTSAHSLEDAKACAEAIGVSYDIVGIEPAMEAFRDDAAAAVRQPQGGRHRGEHPEPRPRRHADGGVEQARRHGGDDRQQVGDGGGLRHALRRHVRRLQRPEGRLQDDGVRALPLAQRASARGRAGPQGQGDPRAHHHQAAVGRAQARPEGRGFAAALSRARRHPEGPDRARPVGRGAGGRRPRRSPPSTRVWRLLEGAEYKRRQAPPGVKITSRLISRERRYPIVNGFQGLTMLIAQISDMHVKPPGELLYERIDTAGFLERAVAHVTALDPRPDIVLATGDLVDGGKPEEYALLRRLLAPLPMPVYRHPRQPRCARAAARGLCRPCLFAGDRASCSTRSRTCRCA